MYPGEQWLFDLFQMHLKELLSLYVEGKISYDKAEKLAKELLEWFLETFGMYHHYHVRNLMKIIKRGKDRGDKKCKENNS